MKHQKLCWVLVLIVAWVGTVLLVSSIFASDVQLIPREVLFGNPLKASPQISPDGKLLSYLAPVDNVLNVWVRTVGTEDDRPVTKDDNRGIRIHFWAADSKHIMYLQDVGSTWSVIKSAVRSYLVLFLSPSFSWIDMSNSPVA